MTRRADLHAFALSLLAFAACSSSTTPPSTNSYPLWSSDPLSTSNPFPDARLIGFDGGLGARPNFWQPLVPSTLPTNGGATFQTFMGQFGQSLQPLAGFGNYGGILVPFSVPIDQASLAAHTFYLAIGGGGALGPDANVTYRAELNFAEIDPSLPLQPAQTYVLVLTDGVLDSSEQALGRSPDFQTFAQSGQGEVLVNAAAQLLGIGASHIIFAMQFVTEGTADLRALATWVKQPAPAPYVVTIDPTPVPISGCGGSAPLGSQCPRGVFTRDAGTLDDLLPWLTVAPFIDGGNGYQDPPVDVGMVIAGGVTLKDARDAEDGTFQAAALADPSTGRDVVRQFVIVTPDPALMPAAGWPMVLVGHGLGQANTLQINNAGAPQFSMCVQLAEFFTKAGFGCIGLDAPSHGSRGSEGAFFNFGDLNVTRDYFREMTFDQMQLQRFAASWPAGSQGISIDATKLSYFGVSLGGIMGSNFLSLDPRTDHGVLNVPGGGLYQIFESPNIFAGLGFILAEEYLGVPFNVSDGGVNPDLQGALPFLEAVAQALLEPGDPINNALLFAPPKHTLMQEGLGDRTVPNETTNALAAALRVPTLQAASSAPNGASGLWKYDLSMYGVDPTLVDPHATFFVVPQARDQVANYLSSFGSDISME